MGHMHATVHHKIEERGRLRRTRVRSRAVRLCASLPVVLLLAQVLEEVDHAVDDGEGARDLAAIEFERAPIRKLDG